MIENKAKIKSGAPKHNPVCYQTLRDIVIPAGTILRYEGDDKFGCGVEGGNFLIEGAPSVRTDLYKKVIA